jgi:TonB family protein
MFAGALAAVLMQAATPQPPNLITNPDWVRRPSREDIARYYPKAAIKEDLAGSAFLVCDVDAEGRLVGCKAEKVSPEGAGFGEAAVAMAEVMRMHPQTMDGRPVAGGVIRLPVNFLIPANFRSAPMRAQHPEVRSEIVEVDCRFTDLRLDNCFAEAGSTLKAAEIALKAVERITLPSLPTARRQGRIVLPIWFTDASGKASPPEIVTRPNWIARPTPGDLSRAYPSGATTEGDAVGNVVVECGIGRRGELEGCAVSNETPPGQGFGTAALSLTAKFKVGEVDAFGLKVEGRRIRIPFRLSPASPPTRGASK